MPGPPADRAARRRGAWKTDAAAAAAAAAALLAILLSFGGIWERVGGTDLHGAFLPKYEVGARILTRELRLPLWNPAEYCGEPLFAVVQGAVLYPPVPILFGTLSPWLALQLLYAFNAFVLAWGMLAYLRGHEVPRWAACAGFAVVVAGFFRGPSFGGIDHPAFFAGVAWIPSILLFWERCWEAARRSGAAARPWLAAMAVAGALQWLSGYPDFSLDTAPLLAVIALVPRPGSTFPRRLGFAVAGLGLAAVLAAVQLVPLAEGILESFRSATGGRLAEIRALFALTTLDEIRIALTSTGVLAVALAMAGLLPRPSRAQVAWLVGFLYCVFANNPPFDLLYRLPGYASIRMPLGWLHIAPLFVGLLVATAAARAAGTSRRAVRAAGIAVVVAVAASSTWQVWRLPQDLRRRAPDYDLLAERRAVLERALDENRDASGSRPRVFALPEQRSGAALRHDLRSPAGYDPTMPPHRVNRLYRELERDPALDAGASSLLAHRNPGLAALLGVGLVAVPPDEKPRFRRAGFREVAALPGGESLLARDPVPRARVVHRAIVVPDDEAAFAATIDPRTDHRATAVVTAEGDGPRLAASSPIARERARIVRESSEEIEIAVALEADGLLVLTDTFYPGWEATVDGEPVPIWRADYAFRGVAVPAGRHTVTFLYRPRSLVLGAAGTAVGAAAAVWLAAPALFRCARRRGRAA